MNPISEPQQTADRPVPLSPAQLAEISEFLPAGATLIGGLALSSETTPYQSDSPGDCVIVIFALDDHTIHRAEVCEVSSHHYEIVSNTVVGSW